MSSWIEASASIQSVAEVARIVQKAKGSTRLLFRGQNVDEPLLPRIARVAEDRGIPYEEVRQIERKMLQRLKRESVPFLGNLQPQTDWDWLCMAQHQGLPTRLLDWSANALAGLWFAVATDPAQDDGDGVLWVLGVTSGNEKAPSPTEDVFELRRTYVFQPFHVDKRIAAQAGWFSVHRYAEAAQKFVPLDQNRKFIKSLRKYTVPSACFESLRRELRLMGVTQATLFPDLSGICADIQAEHLGTLRSPTAI